MAQLSIFNSKISAVVGVGQLLRNPRLLDEPNGLRWMTFKNWLVMVSGLLVELIDNSTQEIISTKKRIFTPKTQNTNYNVYI